MTRIRRSAAAGILTASLTLGGCATSTTLRQAHDAEALHDYDVAVANYTKAAREHPGDRDIQLSLMRAKLRAAEAHLVRGRRLFAAGKYDEAVLDLQIAADLNPTSGDAERAFVGTIMLDPVHIDQARREVPVEWLYVSDYKSIYRQMLSIDSERGEVNSVTVAEALRKAGQPSR